MELFTCSFTIQIQSYFKASGLEQITQCMDCGQRRGAGHRHLGGVHPRGSQGDISKVRKDSKALGLSDGFKSIAWNLA